MSKFEKASKWLGIYGAVLSTLLTTVAVVDKFTPKQHELEIYVADYCPGSETIELTVAYYNTGDYEEILSKVTLVLDQKIDGYENPMRWEQASCSQPVRIEPGKTIYKKYKAKLDFKNDNLMIFKDQKQEYLVSMDFDFISKDQGIASERFPIAQLVPYLAKELGGKASLDFITTKKTVDFKKARPVIVKSSYPIDPKYVSTNMCTNEI